MMQRILEYINDLETGSFEGWSEEEQRAYLTATQSITAKVKSLMTTGNESWQSKIEGKPDHAVIGKRRFHPEDLTRQPITSTSSKTEGFCTPLTDEKTKFLEKEM